jgi:hypothetical protein
MIVDMMCFASLVLRGSENAQHYAVCSVNYMWHRLSDKKPLAFNNPLIMVSGDACDVALDPLIPTKREGGKKNHNKGKKNSPNKITLDSSKSSIWMTNQN